MTTRIDPPLCAIFGSYNAIAKAMQSRAFGVSLNRQRRAGSREGSARERMGSCNLVRYGDARSFRLGSGLWL
jgi:hypothetical protein